MKHLDNEYRDRWEEYYLSDGKTKDSRKINWRDVEWEKVKKIGIFIRDRKHFIDKRGKNNFKGFMRFRWGGREAIYDDKGRYQRHKEINIWTFGWTNGKTAFLKDIDFKTGNLIKTYQMRLSEIRSHVHPNLKI